MHCSSITTCKSTNLYSNSHILTLLPEKSFISTQGSNTLTFMQEFIFRSFPPSLKAETKTMWILISWDASSILWVSMHPLASPIAFLWSKIADRQCRGIRYSCKDLYSTKYNMRGAGFLQPQPTDKTTFLANNVLFFYFIHCIR